MGGALASILFAQFWKELYGDEVILYDPFFNSRDLLSLDVDEITDRAVPMSHIDRFANPLFYLVDLHTPRHIFTADTPRVWAARPFVALSRRALSGRRSYLPFAPGPGQKDFQTKTLDQPYVYWYEWIMAERTSEQPLIRLKNPRFQFERHIAGKTVIGLHIRPNPWKSIRGSLSRNKYVSFIRGLIRKIVDEVNDPVVLYYGAGNQEPLFIDSCLKRNGTLINLDETFSSVIERASALSHMNYSFASVNGFTLAGYVLAQQSGSLRDIFLINDVSDISDTLYWERLTSSTIWEPNLATNSILFSESTCFPKDSILQSNFRDLGNRFSEVARRNHPTKVLFYSGGEFESLFFDPHSDSLLSRLVAEHFQRQHPKFRVLWASDGSVHSLDTGESSNYRDQNITQMQHVMTHYNLRSPSDLRRRWLGRRVFERNRHLLDERMAEQLHASNFLYEDLVAYLYRNRPQLMSSPTRPGLRQEFMAKDSRILFIASRGRRRKRELVPITFAIQSGTLAIMADLRAKGLAETIRRVKKGAQSLGLKRLVRYGSSLAARPEREHLDLERPFHVLMQTDFGWRLDEGDRQTDYQMTTDNLHTLYSSYDVIICSPNPTSLAFRFIDSLGKTMMFMPGKAEDACYSREKLLFRDSYIYSYVDFFQDTFTSERELRIALGLSTF